MDLARRPEPVRGPGLAGRGPELCPRLGRILREGEATTAQTYVRWTVALLGVRGVLALFLMVAVLIQRRVVPPDGCYRGTLRSKH
jgi:hypothetical protein